MLEKKGEVTVCSHKNAVKGKCCAYGTSLWIRKGGVNCSFRSSRTCTVFEGLILTGSQHLVYWSFRTLPYLGSFDTLTSFRIILFSISFAILWVLRHPCTILFAFLFSSCANLAPFCTGRSASLLISPFFFSPLLLF